MQEIAEVIGRERALYLIGRLPQSGRRSWRVSLWVPKRLKPGHPLAELIGWDDAAKLSRVFGGSVIQPSNCRHIHRRFRNEAVREMSKGGMGHAEVARIVGLSVRQVRNIIAKESEQ